MFCLLSKQILFVYIYREREYFNQSFQPLDVQSEIQSSEEPSTEVFKDYTSENTHDAYSSFNDSGEFYKNYCQVFHMANAMITM